MNDQLKRRWFHVSASTAVVLLLVAASLIVLNVTPFPPFQYRYYIYKNLTIEYYGWPIAFAIRTPTTPYTIGFIPGLIADLMLSAGLLYLVKVGLERLNLHWIRFRLSTAMIVMLAASGLLWLNMQISYTNNVSTMNGGWEWTYYGWPRTAYTIDESSGVGEDHLIGYFDTGGVATNVVTALLILGALAFALEWFFRRREMTAKAEPAKAAQ